ncbi:winged helix DNA-binding domain-containing protein [Dysgonomonas sp. 520]|uniref:winged helix DNA-binding domain-containing protein n=1 Tax=Dysgonomonas sp. 520 TaxID=2302931 RepID=UPI0013D6E075|nr:winged helix DNA-binding domain-containing protein [Dysgonomonas sp. 520]NDW08944.1 winged helix DNA-binding domain-containing protein [Dysgonomonas sp. 520]
MNSQTIANIRLLNQQLSGTQLTTPREIVSWMGAMQAQDFNMVKWAIGVRLPDSTEKQVEESLNKGEIIRTHIMRPTWHVVAAEDIGWIMDLTSRCVKTLLKPSDKVLELTAPLLSQCDKIIEKALSGNNHLTRQEIGEKLVSGGVQLDNRRLNHIMYHAELNKLVCSGILKGKKRTYALFDERVKQSRNLVEDEALRELAFRFFSSHAPATLNDFKWWSGLSMTQVRQAAELVKDDFAGETINGQVYLFNNTTVVQNPDDDSILLLPAFDEYTVSYKDRKDIFTFGHYSKVISNNGLFKPIIVHNGQVVGMWKKLSGKKDVTFCFDFFEKREKHIHKLAEKHSGLYKTFLSN